MVGVAKQRLNTEGARVVDMDEVGALVVIDTGNKDGPVVSVEDGVEVGELEFTEEIAVDGEIVGPTDDLVDRVTDGAMEGISDGLTKGVMDIAMGGSIDGKTNGKTDGVMDG